MTNMDNHPKVCRLCLDVISNPNFEALDAVKLAMLKILPLNINPAYTINALICSQCSDKLQHIFHFKMACLDNNDYIKTFLHCDSGFMVVLEETIVRNLSIQDGIKHEEEKVCRFCLKYFDIGQLTKLNGLEEDIFMKDMLEKCLPEINLNITKDPSVCQECTDMLQNQFNFVINCLDVDERIQNFLSSGTNNNDDRLDLSVVLKFDSTQLNGEDDYDIKDISQFVVKKEEIFEDPGESHFQCKVEENLESNLELETIPEECIKLEENIKSDSDSEESLPNSPRQPEEPSFPEAEMLEKNADGMFVCTVCPHQTNRRDSLVKHFSTHRKKPEQPSFPDAEMLTKNADGMFVCTVCPHQTNRRDSLVKHFLTHKKKAEREFKCEECKFVSTYKTSLRLHALLHKDPTELELFYCAECSYKSMHKKHVRRHYKRHTKSSSSKSRMKSDSSVKLYRCQFCSLTSKDKLYFKQHNKIEHDKHIVLVDESGRCEKCEECDYKSKNLRNLLNHMRLTHKIVKNFQPAKKYVCEWCGYRTHKMWNYQEHSLQHKSCDDIEMFKCLHCPFQTKYKSSLRSHLKRHEFGGKPQKENRTAKRGASK